MYYYSLPWILAFLAITPFTSILTLAQSQYEPYQAEDEQVFSLLDNKDVIMHAYKKTGEKFTFTTRFEQNGVFQPYVTQKLPLTTDIEYVQIVHALDKARCRIQYGGDPNDRNQESRLFGPYQKPFRLPVQQAHALECVATVGFTGTDVQRNDAVPESSQKTTFLRAKRF